MKSTVFLVLLILLSACGRERHQPTISHWSGWSDQTIELAGHAWLYAQLALNVYSDESVKDKLKLPKHISLLKSYKSGNGFYSEVFKDDDLDQYIFVIRGTDNPIDWIRGNLPFVENQCKTGLDFYDQSLKEYKVGSMVVVGHSLGGGIATHISLNREVIKSYSFNGSPVFKRLGKNISNERYSIVEHGEALKIARLFGDEATQLYTSIGLSSGLPIHQHSMLPMAIGLTQIAAIRNSAAKNSLLENKLQDKWGDENNPNRAK